MALVSSRLWPERDSFWSDWPSRDLAWRDRFTREWDDWPMDWPRPRELLDRFRTSNMDRWWRDWPSDWPRMDAVMPRFSSQLDRFDRNWRNDPFWRDLYPRWAEPIFKEGIDVKTHITNDSQRFGVEIDAYQFRPEELQVKTLDDTLLIEGQHEDVRDRDNYTKMHFVRKYQLPPDVEPHTITSSIDSTGRLIVEAAKRYQALDGRERAIPIESGATRRYGSRSSSSPRDRIIDSGRGSATDYYRDGAGRGSAVDYYQDGGRESRGSAFDKNYLSPESNGYRTGFETRQTDADGMRHEKRREEFREEIRRSGSQQSIPAAIPISAPLSPLHDYRSESRQSGGGYERNYRRSSSSSRNEFRTAEMNGAASEQLLRPAAELNNGGSRAESRAESRERSVRIART